MEKNKKRNEYILGIDATNLNQGGGITHLVELLRAVNPKQQGINKIYVWGNAIILSALDEQPWLVKCNPPELNRGLIARTLWQHRRLSKVAKQVGCDLLFIPGGSYSGAFSPVVTMSRNLLPFEWRESRRYGWTLLTFKNILLRQIQSRSFRKAAGVIFLTNYAKQSVLKVTGAIRGQTLTIPHGLDARFKQAPKPQRAVLEYSSSVPYRLLYVSIIDNYKHQWHVVDAVNQLRTEGFPLQLELIGPAYSPALKRLNKTLARLDPDKAWVIYHGKVPYAALHEKYAQADLGIFASSCENMPNILLETMAAGLPIACSSRGPMKEVLGDAGEYFDPEKPDEIAHAIRTLLLSSQVRLAKAQAGFLRAQQFQWTRCADETFKFLSQVLYSTRSQNEVFERKANK